MSSSFARWNVAVLLAFLIAMSFAYSWSIVVLAAIALLGAVAARLPLATLLLRGIVVLPFAAVLAIAALLSGDVARAATMLAKSYISIFAVLLFNALTPFPAWTGALRYWHVPESLILTLQFVYRYIFVVGEEARRMRLAAVNRGGFRFDSAASALGVLFARSRRRSEMIHRAMTARGFRGRFT